MFFEEKVTWTANGVFRSTDVHKGCGIFFRTPQYTSCQVDNSVNVCIQLQPSSGAVGNALRFEFFLQFLVSFLFVCFFLLVSFYE